MDHAVWNTNIESFTVRSVICTERYLFKSLANIS